MVDYGAGDGGHQGNEDRLFVPLDPAQLNYNEYSAKCLVIWQEPNQPVAIDNLQMLRDEDRVQSP